MPSISTTVEQVQVPGIKVKAVPTVAPAHSFFKSFIPIKERFGRIPISNPRKPQMARPKIKIPSPGEGLPRVVQFCADQSGCGFWRMLWPAADLLAYNKVVMMNLYQMVLDPRFYGGLDAVRVQRQATDSQLEFMKFLRKTSNEYKRQTGKGFKILYDVDDICVPYASIADYNVCKQGFENDQLLVNMKEIVHMCIHGDMQIHCLVDGLPSFIPIKEVHDLYNSGNVQIQILSKNLETEEIEYKNLQNCWITSKEAEILEIHDSVSGKFLKCTAEHPIKTQRGWVEAGNLLPDDVLDII